MIEDDYYDEEEPRSNKHSPNQKTDNDEDEVSSGGAGDDAQAMPAFDNLPSVRSRLTDQSYELPQSSSRQDQPSTGKKLTANALAALGGKARDFENLPSMRSDSQASSTKPKKSFN